MANVLDFTCDSTPNDMIRDIFNHQHQLAEKYIPIEKNNGLCLYDQLPAEIDDAKAQARIKDMSWRAIEEVAEAFEALDLMEYTHFYEEMADALHFLVEKYLLCNFLPVKPGHFSEFFLSPHVLGATTDVSKFFEDCSKYLAPISKEGTELPPIRRAMMDSQMAEFTKNCGLTCNCLKNKPWKQSQMLTDIPKFRHRLSLEFESFISLCAISGFTADSLYAMYIRKNQVNQFRQRSNY